MSTAASNLPYRFAHCQHCGCEITNETVAGISDGSSVYAWRCLACAHEWPRHSFVRARHKLNDKTKPVIDGATP